MQYIKFGSQPQIHTHQSKIPAGKSPKIGHQYISAMECIQFIITQMLSTKTQTLNGQLKKPFGGSQSAYSGFSNSFNQYCNNSQSNLQLLKRRFSHEDSNKIKELLEEFDNNIQMVAQILLQSQDKQHMICEKPSPKKVGIEDENRLLKNAVARLYKKIVQQQKQLEQIKSSHQKTKRENDDLKLQNRLLLQKEFDSNSFQEEREVY